MADYGYTRVSTREQNDTRQLAALAAQGIPKRNMYSDKKSGKDFDRPAYQRLLRKLKPGDRLYIKSIDRLGRDYKEIMEQWKIISKDKGVDITVLDMPLLDTTNNRDLLGTFISDVVLQILSFVAQNERENIRQRQAEGIAIALARGVKFGRRKIELPQGIDSLMEDYRRRIISKEQLEERCGMVLGVVYKKLRERKNTPAT